MSEDQDIIKTEDDDLTVTSSADAVVSFIFTQPADANVVKGWFSDIYAVVGWFCLSTLRDIYVCRDLWWKGGQVPHRLPKPRREGLPRDAL